MSAPQLAQPAQPHVDFLVRYYNSYRPPVDGERVFTVPADGSTRGLISFLDRFPPSKTHSTATENSIWIVLPHKRPDVHEGHSRAQVRVGTKMALAAFERLEATCKRADEVAPRQGNNMTGLSAATRKKDAIRKFDEELRDVARVKGLLAGRWQIAVYQLSRIDKIFRELAHSVVAGPLSRCPVDIHTLRVDCYDKLSERTGNRRHLVSVYFERVWDRAVAGDVARVLLREHGLVGRAPSQLHTVLDVAKKVAEEKRLKGLEAVVWGVEDVLNEWDRADLEKEWRVQRQSRERQREAEMREWEERDMEEDVTEDETEDEEGA